MNIYKNKTYVVSVILAAVVMLSYAVPLLGPFRDHLYMYVKVIWKAVLLGILFSGLIDHFIPREYISKVLASKKKKTIFNAALLGFLMSACSHGILALSIQLHKKGASTSSVVAFLLASPWANLPLTFMLIGFFGVAKGLYIVVSAFVIAVITGLIFQRLEHHGLVEVNAGSAEVADSFSIFADIRARAKAYRFNKESVLADIKGVCRGMVSLGDMVLWWMIIGMAMASAAGAYIPQGIFTQYMGPSVVGMIITLIVATVLEVCSEGTSPLAFEIYRSTGALGNSFVFLMAGVATDYTEIGLLWHNVGKRTAIWLPVITVPQIILLGVSANLIF